MRTYGTVCSTQGDKPKLLIKCEPHVMMKLKQVFPRVNPQLGVISMLATEDVARDLEWFLTRFPMEVTQQAQDLMTTRARAYDRRRELTAAAMLGEAPPIPGRQMALPARSYQRVAADLAHASGALLLADSLGVGKTVSAIKALSYDGSLPAVVVCPTHLTRQWAAELERFLPGIRTHIAKVGKPYDMRKRTGRKTIVVGQPPEVVILNYAKIAGWAEHLYGWARAVIFDEAQHLRRAKSDKYAGCQRVASGANIVMGLSGTPIYGYGDEWFNVFNCLKHGFLGSREEFLREWCVHEKGQGEDAKYRIKDPRAFGAYLYESGLMLRRSREDVGRELPPFQAIWHEVDHDEGVLAQIDGTAAELARGILGMRPVDPRDLRDMSAEFANQLRQQTGLAKAPFVADFVRMLVESGEKVALFGWHRSVYDLWRERLKDLQLVWFTGSETDTQKQQARARFIDGAADVMVMSLRSGEGLDGLQGVCSVAVIGELDWSPQVMEQCIGRVYRDGQTKPVLAYYLVARDGADPGMLGVADVKRTQMIAVRDPGGALVEATTVDPDHIKKLAARYLEQRGRQ